MACGGRIAEGPLHRTDHIHIIAAAAVGGIVLLTATATAGAATHVSLASKHRFTAVADTFVARSRPHSNFGRRSTLQARARSATIYLRFKMSGIEGEILGAKLALHARERSGTRYAVRAAASNRWNERTTTWANAPGVSRIQRSMGRIGARRWTVVDVTRLVDGARVVNGTGVVSFAVTSASPTTVRFASRETARKPKLFVKSAHEGTVSFMKIANSSFDSYTENPTPAQQQWMRDRYARMLTWSPYFDSRTSWYSTAWMYKDAYAIYTSSQLALDHPEWILRDASGNKLYIPYGCSGGTCPQYAADFGNPAFRSYWIRKARQQMAFGYKGLFMDDVNMDWRVGDGNGDFVAPIDPRTGTTMRESNWRRYMAEFTEQVRQAVPSAEIVHNAIWYAGQSARDGDPYVQRELNAADYINLERGATDAGLRGGTGSFGYETFLAYIDRRHANGVRVILESKATSDLAAREYNLASYFLINSGADLVSTKGGGSPADWWSGYSVRLGAALGPRYAWKGLLRRDFQNGMVLVNQPDTTQKRVSLPKTYVGLSGNEVTTVTLDPARGLVLRVR